MLFLFAFIHLSTTKTLDIRTEHRTESIRKVVRLVPNEAMEGTFSHGSGSGASYLSTECQLPPSSFGVYVDFKVDPS